MRTLMAMDDEEVDMEQVVVGFDGSRQALEALRWAAREAERRGWDVLVVQSWRERLVGERPIIEIWQDPEAGLRAVQAALDDAVDTVAQDHPAVRFSSLVVGERADRALVELSAEAPMVVVGARGRGGFSSLLLGSVSQHVASRASCTVVVVRTGTVGDGDVVVGVDGSDASRRALSWAAEAARQSQRRLKVVLAWSYLLPESEHGLEPFRASYTAADARRALETIVKEVLGSDPGLEVELEATCDLAARALIERGGDAALLVVGPEKSPSRAWLDLGSVTLQVLHHVSCPLAIVRSVQDRSGTDPEASDVSEASTGGR